jgi:hypothetical protein
MIGIICRGIQDLVCVVGKKVFIPLSTIRIYDTSSIFSEIN